MKTPVRFIAPLMAAIALALGNVTVEAASHREAPLIANDPTADNTDVYFFRSWEDPSKVVLIMNINPGQEPGSGPNYFNFDDDVTYAFNLDTNSDGSANELRYEIRFKTQTRGPLAGLKAPLVYVALPPITALDGPGSEGLISRQIYTVTQIKNGVRTELSSLPLYAVPSNMGPRTMPSYEALADQGVFPLNNGGRAFAGQRDETFYIDLGATFDTLNFRRKPLPILSATEDTDDFHNPFGNDTLSGLNVSTIAIELPITEISNNPNAVIGMYASTSRQKFKVLAGSGSALNSGPLIQISRMANPLVNELIIGAASKDRWNASAPKDESQFIDFYLNSRLATAINLVFNTTFPTANRTDLVNALLKYPTQAQTGTCTADSPCSELLRLNLAVAPTLPSQQKRLSILAGDNAGWPNGRRPNDDVTDIALRVVAGALLGPVPALGDGVNFNIGAESSNVTPNGVYEIFPFLPTPHDGVNRRHIDCDETDANPC